MRTAIRALLGMSLITVALTLLPTVALTGFGVALLAAGVGLLAR